MRLYIPTAGRPYSQLTTSFISEHWLEHTSLVAPQEDADILRGMGYPVLEHPPIVGIARKREWIMRWHRQHHPKDGRLLMLDDDLRFAKRRFDDPTKFLPLDGGSAGTDWDEMMELLLEIFEVTPLVGLSPRGGANRNVQPYRLNARIHGVIGVNANTAAVERIRFDRVPLMEDFDLGLQFLTKGFQSVTLNTHVWDDRGINLEGGCSTYRDHEVQAAAANRMAQLWPRFVTVTERPGWHGAMAGQRLDVRIQWAKAHAAGREARDYLGVPQEPELDWSTGTLDNLGPLLRSGRTGL